MPPVGARRVSVRINPHTPPSSAGNSASKTRVNALVSRGSRLGGHRASLSGVAGTSPAMTPSVWIALSEPSLVPQIDFLDLRIGLHRLHVAFSQHLALVQHRDAMRDALHEL